MPKMLIITLISIMVVVIGANVIHIVVTDPPPNTLIQHPVENIEFVRGNESNDDQIFIKTDRENLIVTTYNLAFIRDESNGDLLLDEIQFASSRSMFTVKPYNLHIPEEQFDAINAEHMEIFGRDISLQTEE